MMRMVEIDGDREQKLIGRAAHELVRNRVDAVWIHGFAKGDVCDAIAENFQKSSALLPRKDNVPGLMVGESHYAKTPSAYYETCRQSCESVDSLFEGTEDPVRRLYTTVGRHLERNVRAAHFAHGEALHTRAIAWQDRPSSSFLLQPHDDVSQVFCERNRGWEIVDIRTLLAVNFYASCKAGQGMLRVYDLRHSPELAMQAKVEGVGYPYPAELLSSTRYTDLAVRTGDLVLLNGAFIHGVTRSQEHRIVLNSFLGDLRDDELIYWT